MPQRLYPVSYLIMIGLILLLSLLLVGNFVGEAPRFSHLSFFFFGAGFMLVETKGITEMGLTFGNTWQVIGIVFAGILIMAFLGNCLVQWLHIKRSHLAYLFLLAALAAGWLAARSGGFASTPSVGWRPPPCSACRCCSQGSCSRHCSRRAATSPGSWR